jgi:hypothetical protein
MAERFGEEMQLGAKHAQKSNARCSVAGKTTGRRTSQVGSGARAAALYYVVLLRHRFTLMPERWKQPQALRVI